MCGIAGFSLSAESELDGTLVARTLLAAIAERGADAVGYGYRGPGLRISVHKQQTGASELLESLRVPAGATQILLHVRDYTKGHPALAANNHPIRHGAVVGIHNGIVKNDEEVFARHGFERAEPGMTVDSEAIFALVDRFGSKASPLEELHGSMTTAWLDERVPDALFLARGIGRPLWVGESRHELLFASTREALELIERYARVSLRRWELPEGTLLAAVAGRPVRREAFAPDRSFVEETVLPSVRAPEEGLSSLELLAALVAPAGAP